MVGRRKTGAGKADVLYIVLGVPRFARQDLLVMRHLICQHTQSILEMRNPNLGECDIRFIGDEICEKSVRIAVLA